MVEGPKREAVLRGFMALVLDMVRVDPDRKPSRDMIRWYQELAGDAGLTPTDVPTARALLEEGLRLMKAGREHQTTVAAGA